MKEGDLSSVVMSCRVASQSFQHSTRLQRVEGSNITTTTKRQRLKSVVFGR